MVRSRFALILYFRIAAHEAAGHTLSKEFLYQWRHVQILLVLEIFSHRILRLKICSVVLLPALNPAYYSAIISSALGLSLFKMIFSMSLLE